MLQIYKYNEGLYNGFNTLIVASNRTKEWVKFLLVFHLETKKQEHMF